MKLFELFATLGLDSKSFNTGLSKAGSAMKSTAKTIGTYSGKIEKTVSSAFKVITKAGVVGFTAIKGASIAIGKQALETRSSIEQGIGGAAAVFGDYANQITSAAQGAYKTAGLSMADYLETANKMGALFKGSGFDVQEASDMTQQSMQRAADVASIMGVDIKTAMESIAGAAKGNFTMLDNLGVATNDGLLEAYRVEKGIDKAVSKMTTAEKVGLAMKRFMEQTTYAAGNYADENDTVAGSLQTLKGAWANFLGGVEGTTFRDVENSAFGFVINASKSMGLSSLAPALTRVREFVDEVAEIVSMDDASGKQKYRAIEARIMVRSYKMFKNLGRKLPGQIADIGDEIVRTISNANSAAPLWLETGKQIFDAIRMGVRKSAVALKGTASILSPAIISGLLTTKSDFISIGLDILTGIADGITQDAKSDNPQIKSAFQDGLQTVINSATETLPALVTAGTSILDAILDGVNGSDLTGLSTAIETAVTNIVTWVADPENLESLVKAGWKIGKALIDGILTGLGRAGAKIIDKLIPGAGAEKMLDDSIKTQQRIESTGMSVMDMVKHVQDYESSINKSTKSTNLFGNALQSVTTDAQSFVLALNSIPTQKTVKVNVVNGFSGGGGNHTSYLMDTAYGNLTTRAKPFASGIPYVPYDNFYSRLHRGEMVLTRQQAEDYRAKRAQEFEFDYAQMGAAVGAAIDRNMRYLSRQTRAADVVNELGRRINRREGDLVRGMGG